MAITPIEILKFCNAIEKKAEQKEANSPDGIKAIWSSRALTAREIAHYIALHIYEKKSKKPKPSDLFD
jgi:hypothetical protein